MAQAELRADLIAHPDPERWGGDAVATMMPWQPVVDGDVIPARPIDRINSSLTPCALRGLRLPLVETAVGRSMISAAGRPGASIQRRRSCTILDPRSVHCGRGGVSFWAK
jgi:hypothetical protein